MHISVPSSHKELIHVVKDAIVTLLTLLGLFAELMPEQSVMTETGRTCEQDQGAPPAYLQLGEGGGEGEMEEGQREGKQAHVAHTQIRELPFVIPEI